MCDQHNVRASAGNDKGRTQTKDTHPNPGHKLKFLIPPGIEPGPPDWKAGALFRLHNLAIKYKLIRFSYSLVSPTFPSLHLRHSSFSNPSGASPTSQALHTSPGEPPMPESPI